MGGRLVGVGLLCAGALGCSIETGGLAMVDAGPPDTGAADAGPDATPPVDAPFDAGPPPDAGCHTFEPPAALFTLGTDDFEAMEAEHRGTGVEAPGLLVIPAQPFRRGALLARAYDGVLLDEPPDLADVSGTPTGYAFIGDLNQSWSGSAAPEGLQIEGRDRYTLAAEGEIRLVAGAVTVDFEPDDRGLIEVDVTDTTHRAVAPSSSTRGRVTFTVPADGWYPIRLAYSDTGDASRLRVYVAMGGAERAVPSPDMLRADIRMLPGQEVLGFSAAPPDADVDGARIDEDDTDQNFGMGRPVDVGLDSDDGWSVRWLGRWTFDAADPSIRAETDGMHRLWVHGVYYGGQYGTGVADTTYNLRVAPGTNDVVFELDEMYGDARTRTRLDGSTVPADRMRPATRFGGWAFGAGSLTTSQVIAAGTMETVDADLGAPATPPATVVEVSGVIETMQPEAVTLLYTPPGGTEVRALLMAWGERASGDRWVFRTVAPAPPGGVDGVWRIGAHNGGGTPATLVTAAVLSHHGADAAPYAAMASFTSAPRMLPDRTRITSVELDAYTLFGTSVELFVAAADDPAALSSPWWYPVAPDGTVDGAAGSVVLIRADLRGAGVDTPRVTQIRAHGGACVE